MMRRALSFLTTEVRGLHAAAYILAASSLGSSVLALLRDRMLAHLFGAGAELDIYYAAFRIPDVIFIGIGALVSAYMLIPELSRRDAVAQRRYLDTVVAGFSVLVALTSAVAFVMTPSILQHVFPKLSEAGYLALLTSITRIMLLQAIFLGFSNIAASVTQYKHRYALYAASPLVYNLGIIMGALVLYPRYGLAGLAWGVVAGAFLHFAIQLPSIWRDGFFRRLPRYTEGKAFRQTIRLSLPRALALSMNQLAFIGLFALAGTLATGSISVFMFAFNLQSVPLSVIGASYATAAFPTLAYAFSRGERKVFLMQVGIAARQILFWSMPALALLVVLRAHVVRAVLGSGSFDWTDTRLTAAALALFAFSLAAQGLMLLLIRAFYAAGRTLAPFLISLLSAGLTVAFGIAFLRVLEIEHAMYAIEGLLRVQDLVGTQVLVLALAYTLASVIATVVIAVYFHVQFGGFFKEINRAWWESLVAALLGGGAAYAALNLIGDITLSSTLASVLLKAAGAGMVGIAVSALAYFLLGSKEFAENVQTLRRRLWREAEPVTSAEQSA